MDFNGKKTERLRVAISADVAREIRALADLECRELQDQVRFLLMRGLEHCRAIHSNRHHEERASTSGRAVPTESVAKDFSGRSVTSESKFPPVRARRSA